MQAPDPFTLGTMAVDALERIAFIMSEVSEIEDLPEPLTPTRCARISISGVAEGRIWLESDDAFVCELAAGMLGNEPEETDADTEGQMALAELANIVGGSLAEALGGADHEHRLGLPESVDGEGPATADGNATADADAKPDGHLETHVVAELGTLRMTWVPVSSNRAAA
ncbi:MAG: chemotaxis protein CheX [Phycisphaerales bacterium]